MADKEWFRRTTWTEEDRADFRAQLRRSRNAVKQAQYLRIQAHYLEHKAYPPEITAALELLEELLRDYSDSSEVAETYRQQASCLARLGRLQEALRALRQALDTERKHSSILGTAYLDYAELSFG